MSIPGYVAGASSYRTTNSYAGRVGWATREAGGIVAQVDCSDKCAAFFFGCSALCSLSSAGWGLLFCLAGCGLTLVQCQDACQEEEGGGGRAMCCPSGTSCRCGGSCMMTHGRLRCVEGMCLSPRQSCP